MTTDLGTYHVRVQFTDGRGFIQRIFTGRRYSHGRHETHPLTATPIKPTWESEEDLIRTMVFSYTEGNYSCDCNRKAFLADAAQEDHEDDDCGDEIQLERLTLIRPDGSELVIWEGEE